MIRFWSNSSSVTVTAGQVVTAYFELWLKGDLNNDGIAADTNENNLDILKDASVSKITPLSGIVIQKGFE